MYFAALNGLRNQFYTTTKPIIKLRMVFMRGDNLSPHLEKAG